MTTRCSAPCVECSYGRPEGRGCHAPWKLMQNRRRALACADAPEISLRTRALHHAGKATGGEGGPPLRSEHEGNLWLLFTLKSPQGAQLVPKGTTTDRAECGAKIPGRACGLASAQTASAAEPLRAAYTFGPSGSRSHSTTLIQGMFVQMSSEMASPRQSFGRTM